MLQHVIAITVFVKLSGSGRGQSISIQTVGDDWQRYYSTKTKCRCYFACLWKMLIYGFSVHRRELQELEMGSENCGYLTNPAHSLQVVSLGGCCISTEGQQGGASPTTRALLNFPALFLLPFRPQQDCLLYQPLIPQLNLAVSVIPVQTLQGSLKIGLFCELI